jgi:serine/threonine protein kinase
MIGSGAAGTVFRTVYQGQTVAVKKFNVVLLEKDDLRDFLTYDRRYLALSLFRLLASATHTSISTNSETTLLCRLSHPCIVRFLGAATVWPNLAIVLEFIPNGSLAKLLRPGSQVAVSFVFLSLPMVSSSVSLWNSASALRLRPPSAFFRHMISQRTQNKDLSWPLRLKLGLDIARGMAYLHRVNILHRDLKSGTNSAVFCLTMPGASLIFAWQTMSSFVPWTPPTPSAAW